MLAIHARMEAVKAPDGGPGFAVVADEMSAFAADAEAASAQVGEQMAATRAAIETAVAAVQAMAAAVGGGRGVLYRAHHQHGVVAGRDPGRA